MGAVYRAVDERLGREVAIKSMPSHRVADPEARARFLREARAAAALAVENVATVYQVIEEPDGTILLVMELVRGETLRARLVRGLLPLTDALRLGATLARAVQCAHEHGIIHRDLKPENVMITPEGKVKVLDFGVARWVGVPGPVAGQLPDGALTVSGGVLGTPGYMAPEQALGGPVDSRADIFALGVILYEMVVGHRAFRGNSLAELLAATTRDEPIPPSTLNPKVPPALEQLLAHTLSKNPTTRLGSAAELERQLDSIASQMQSVDLEPTLNQEAGTTMRTATDAPVARAPQAPQHGGHMWTVVAVAVGLVLVLGGGTIGLGLLGGSVPWLRLGANGSEEPKVGLGALAVYFEATDSRRNDVNSPAFWQAAARDFERAAAAAGAPARWRAAASFAEGEEFRLRGRLAESEASQREAIALDPTWDAPLIGLSSTLVRAERPEEAIEAAQRAQGLNAGHWLPIAATARALAAKGDLDVSIQEFRRALSLAGSNPALRAELALAYHAAEIDDEAARQAQLALEGDPDLVSARILLAERALERGAGAEALQHTWRAVSAAPREAPAWLAHADALTLVGRRDEARRAYQTALHLFDTTGEKGAPEARIAQARAALARAELPVPRTLRDVRSAPIAAPAAPAVDERSKPEAKRTRPSPASAPPPGFRSSPQEQPGF